MYPCIPLSRRGNGTSALAVRFSVLVNTTSLFTDLWKHQSTKERGNTWSLSSHRGINTTCTQLVVHWYCDTIVGFLRSSVKVVQLWCFWVNSPLFECTWKQQQQQQKTPHLKKKKNKKPTKNPTHPCQAGGGMGEYFDIHWWQGCPRISFLFDSCDRWQCEWQMKARKECWDGVGGTNPTIPEALGGVQWQFRVDTHSPLQRAALLQCENQVKNVKLSIKPLE